MTLEEFEKKIQNLRRTTSEDMDKRILDDAFDALQESAGPRVYIFPWKTIAAAVIVIAVVLVTIYSFNKQPQQSPEKIIQKTEILQEEKLTEKETKQPVMVDLKEEKQKLQAEKLQAELLQIASLASAEDVNGLIAVLQSEDSSHLSKLAAANYLADIGDLRAAQILEEIGKQYGNDPNNPFTLTAEKIRKKFLEKAKPIVETFAVDRITEIQGIVIDEFERTYENVYIAPVEENIYRGTNSDSQGYFKLIRKNKDQNSLLAYSQAASLVGLFKIPESYDGNTLKVVLKYNTAEVEGRVVDNTGRGLNEKEINLVLKTGDGQTYRLPTLGKTDKYGYYTATQVPCGSDLTIMATLSTDEPNQTQINTSPMLLSDMQIHIVMPPLIIGGEKIQPDFDENFAKDGKIPISGKIVNEQREPIEDVEVRLSFDMPGYMGIWSKYTTTDDKGSWSHRIPEKYSNLSFRLSHPDYLSYHFDQSARRPSIQELTAGTSIMVLKRGLLIEGRVLDENNQPIQNVLVTTGRLYSKSPRGEIIEDDTTDRTLNDGYFSIGGLPEKEIELFVSANGYAPKIESVHIDVNTPPVIITLKPGITYQGQVVDIEGKPIEAVRIDIGEWQIDNKNKTFTRITKTNPQGLFKIENVPDEGNVRFDFGKKESSYLGFSKMMPEDLSDIDKIVMYEKPTFNGQVIGANNGQPITDFTLIHGIKWKYSESSISWSRYYKETIQSKDGRFNTTWKGFHITYPFDGTIYLKVSADGYFSEICPSLSLGEKLDPFTLSLIWAEPISGFVIDPNGNSAVQAEVALVRIGEKAFINNGKFDMRGLSLQAELIIRTNEDGSFELQPSKEKGLIVVVHETGYAQIKSDDYENNSAIELLPWASIKGTFVKTFPDQPKENINLQLHPTDTLPDSNEPSILWMFDTASFSEDTFTFEYIPSIELRILCENKEIEDIELQPQIGERLNIDIQIP